jgi:hypothetical protein
MEKAPLGIPFIGEPKGGQPASSCRHCPTTLSQRCGGLAKELDSGGEGRKEGEGGRPATNLWLTGHSWPPLNPYFHPPLHLAPIMLTPRTESIRSKANSFHHFPKFYLFIIFLKIFILYYAMMK